MVFLGSCGIPALGESFFRTEANFPNPPSRPLLAPGAQFFRTRLRKHFELQGGVQIAFEGGFGKIVLLELKGVSGSGSELCCLSVGRWSERCARLRKGV